MNIFIFDKNILQSKKFVTDLSLQNNFITKSSIFERTMQKMNCMSRPTLASLKSIIESVSKHYPKRSLWINKDNSKIYKIKLHCIQKDEPQIIYYEHGDPNLLFSRPVIEWDSRFNKKSIDKIRQIF